MLILGIDPGTARTGYGFIEADGDNLSAVSFGCITTPKEATKSERLALLHSQLLDLIKEYKPQELAVEMLFFNKNTMTALTVGEARGVILLAAELNKVPVSEYTPLQVKESLSGYGRASKQEVKEMVKVHLGLEKIKGPDDVADALAIAICHSFYKILD